MFHITVRGNDKQDIFLDDADRRDFLNRLKETKAQRPFTLYAYCLMSNHFHLLLEVDDCPTSVVMQKLLTGYSQHFNSRHGHVGHVFQGRFTDRLCQRDSYFLALIRYIHLNPVRAGMVQKADDWPWSSHGEYSGRRQDRLVDTRTPLGCFGYEEIPAQTGYAEFMSVTDAVLPVPKNPQAPIYKNQFKPLGRTKTLESLGVETARLSGVSIDILRGASRLRSLRTARRLFVRLALQQGFTAAESGVFLNRSATTVSRLALSIEKQR
ncbi:MAG: transposase [Elusimicrobiota bacterium]